MFLLFATLGHAGTWELVRERRSELAPATPTPAERLAYAALVRDLARAAPAGTLPTDAHTRAGALGLELLRKDDVAWLVERGEPRGVGLVALRVGPLAEDLVVQAPHPFSDLHTGAVTAAMFDAGELRAACIATVHRNAGPGADPAHAPESWFQSATDGLAEALDDPLFVQLHGFAPTTSDADAVLSAGGARLPADRLADAMTRIGVALGAADVRSGADVPALAARGNVQGRLLAGRARFLHLEISARLRAVLGEEPGLRAALSDALLLIAGGAG